MKKFFAFAIAIIAMATTMVSCNNDDAEFIEQPAPVAVQQEEDKMMDIDFVVAVTSEQQAYYNESYVIEFAGKQINVALSDMKPATAQHKAAFTSAQQVADACLDSEVVYYAFTLGQVSSYSGAKIVSHNIEVKADHPTDQANFMMNAAYFVVNGRVTSNHVSSEVYKGVYGTDKDLNKFAQIAMENVY